jgi:hypothetical protein
MPRKPGPLERSIMDKIDNTDLEAPLAMLYEAIEKVGLDPLELDIYNDQDMVVYALHYLLANLDHAFEIKEG